MLFGKKIMLSEISMKSFFFKCCIWLSLSIINYNVSLASDHADPLFHKDPEKSLAGLFVFPRGDNLVVILNFYPGMASLSQTTEFHHLDELSYQVHFDLKTPISFQDDQFNQRFGGKLLKASDIRNHASLEYILDKKLKLISFKKKGLLKEAKIVNIFAGVRDDPFIFPKFFGKNVISLVSEIPLSSFPKNQKDFVIWGGIYDKDGDKMDHVGRSNRTMQPRLDFLNDLEPKDHLKTITKRHNKPNFYQKFLMRKLAPLFAIRDYDLFPDVMIYTTRHPARFPNGRNLIDDVADISCRTGDCLLWELSFGDVKVSDWPRKTVNDKPFLNDFPYLAEPW